MTSYPPEPGYEPGYTPPPPTADPAGPQYAPPAYPGYGQAGYQQPGYGYPPAYGQPPAYGPPPGYPGYGQPAYGYPPAGYPAYGYGYAPVPGNRRPGTATAASVLAYVVAGFLVIAGIILISGASFVNNIGDQGGFDTSSATAELAFDGVVDFLAAGLLIAGGVQFAGRKARGRIMLLVGVGIVVAAGVYWLARIGTVIIFWPLLFAAPLIVAASLASTSAVRAWLNS